VDAKTGKILDVNDSYCKMVGRTKEETLSMSVREVEALESDSEMAATFKDIVEKQSHSFVATHRRKDGSLIKLEVNTRYSDMNGGIIFTFMKDITEKLKLQKRLADGEKIFKQFADNVKDVFWVKAPGKMLFINKAFETVWGVSREAIYKNPEIFVDKIIEEDREKVKKAFINEMVSDEHIFDEEYRIVDETGKIKWIHARSYPIFDSKGAYVRNTGIARDISAQKQLEDVINKLNHELIKMVDSEMQKRLERELAFEGIFDISGNCLCIIDEQGVIEEANKKFLSFFELETKEEAVGKFFGKLLSPVEYMRAEDKLKQVIADCTKHSCYCAYTMQSSKRTDIPYEWRFRKKSGADAVVLASVACFQKGDGQKRSIASIVDITRIRELEAREKERERLLAYQSKMAAMGEMIGAIAHQWRQPLNLLGILVQNIRYSFYDGELNRENIEKYTTNAIDQINFT
ncbi:MAG TPA: PAS domain-containing protein, partial [Campylobacterales bacterium]|nr:PAS domain-containing protein [Campylobacterales bacterium]